MTDREAIYIRKVQNQLGSKDIITTAQGRGGDCPEDFINFELTAEVNYNWVG